MSDWDKCPIKFPPRKEILGDRYIYRVCYQAEVGNEEKGMCPTGTNAPSNFPPRMEILSDRYIYRMRYQAEVGNEE